MEEDFEQSDNSQPSSLMSQSNDEEMEEDFPYEHCEGNFSFLLPLIDLGRAIGPFLLHSLRLFAIKSAKSVGHGTRRICRIYQFIVVTIQ